MPIDTELTILVRSNHLADGEPDLGERLTRAFLAQLLERGQLPARLLLMGTGVFLSTEGSPVLEELRRLEAAGTRVSSCGTCLDYYQRREKLAVGSAGNMKETVAALLAPGRVLTF